MIDTLSPRRVSIEQPPQTLFRVAQPIGIIQVGTLATTVYDNSGTHDFLIPSLWASNITGAAATLTLHAVPLSASATDANAIMKNFSLDANSGPVAVCSETGIRIRLQPGMTLVALSNTLNAINMGGWGHEARGGDL